MVCSGLCTEKVLLCKPPAKHSQAEFFSQPRDLLFDQPCSVQNLIESGVECKRSQHQNPNWDWTITQQDVDDSDSAHNTMERQRESGLPGGVAPVAKADADRVDAAEEERREELLELAEAVRDKVWISS